jgi:hypothetical protein
LATVKITEGESPDHMASSLRLFRFIRNKLAILFDETDSFPVADSDRQSRSARSDPPPPPVDAVPPREKQQRGDQESGCLSFRLRRSRAESNPFLTDFFRKFQDRARLSHSK